MDGFMNFDHNFGIENNSTKHMEDSGWFSLCFCLKDFIKIVWLILAAVCIYQLALGFGCKEFYGHIAVILRQTILNIIVPQHASAHMQCTAALDESVHQIWHDRFVYSWELTRSSSVSLNQKFYCFCMFWSRNFTKLIQKFPIWNNRLFQMPLEGVEWASPQPNARVFA